MRIQLMTYFERIENNKLQSTKLGFMEITAIVLLQ